MEKSAERMYNNLTNIKADECLVNHTKQLMKTKLSKKRNEGYGGWHKLEGCSNIYLLTELKKHVEKGDMIDVVNFAAMILARSAIYGNQA